MNGADVILASASPRRAELIARLPFAAAIAPSGVAEDRLPLVRPPRRHAAALARAKALDVSRRHPGSLVIGADTLVELDGAVLGKPADPEAALGMLRRLAGRKHAVHTGLVLAASPPNAPGRPGPDRESRDGSVLLSAIVTSIVTFHRAAEDELRAYVATGEPLDKAGAYGIQGRGGALVEKLDGCFTNVVGLPLCALVALLERATGRAISCPAEERCRPSARSAFRCHASTA